MRDLVAMRAALAARRTMAFDWKANDCARYADAAIIAQGGASILKGLRYASAAGAARLAKAQGGIAAMMDARKPRVAPAMAQRGDVAGVPDPVLGVALMIVEGATLVGPGEQGEKRLPRGAMTHAWSALP